MIYTIERATQHILDLLGGWMFAFGITTVVAIALLAFLSLNLYKFDKEQCLMALRRLFTSIGRGWAWGLVAVVVLLSLFGLDVLHKGLMQRLAQENKALYISAEDQGGGPTAQRAPTVAYIETSTRQQRIVVPPNTVNNLNELPGWSPEEARYGSHPAINVQDELVRDDKTVVINRTTTTQRFVDAKLASSNVDLKLHFRDRQLGQRRQFYEAEFSGHYTYVNPFDTTTRFHFNFPLPDNSGTLAGFHFKINGQELPPGDISDGFVYESDLAPKAKTTVDVTYTNLGSQAWSYDVAGRREPIADFHMQVHVDKTEVKFKRGSLYPTTLSDATMAWDLQNQITSQSINLYFPVVNTEELIGNLYVWSPIGLTCFVAMTMVWIRLRRTATDPWTVVLATLVACAGYALTSYLVSYVPMWLALLLGFSSAAGLQVVALGKRLWIPVLMLTIAPFTFLAAGQTGFLLSILGMAGLAVTIAETLRTRDAVVH